MKLPDFLQWAELTALRQRMGASQLGELRLTADPNRLTEIELERLVNGGLDVSNIDEVRVLPDGTLAYKDSRVLLYIRDIASYTARGFDQSKLPRFHLADCDTLQQMRREKRYGRYVVAARQDGLFEVNRIDSDRTIRSSPEHLRVCQNCLALLAFDGFHDRMGRTARESKVKAFKLERFFEQYPRALFLEVPLENSDSAPLNTYPDDFDELSRRTKEQRGWRCEGETCGVVLADLTLRKHLHVHHINGQKHDSRPENLMLLCSVCHADQPYHSHMQQLREVQEFRPMRERLLGRTSSPNRGARSRDQAALADAQFSDGALRALLRVHNVEYEDNRPRNGAVWVRLGRGPSDVVSRLERWGFKYKEGRGWWRN